MSYRTIFTAGEKMHIHEDRWGKRTGCYQKHGKQQTPYMGLTLALLLVEVVLGFVLMNRYL
jgi:hypothetical protein